MYEFVHEDSEEADNDAIAWRSPQNSVCYACGTMFVDQRPGSEPIDRER